MGRTTARRALARGLVVGLLIAAAWAPVWPPEVAFTRYHSGPSLDGFLDDGVPSGQSSQALLPPVAWVVQDWEGTIDACPVLLGLAIVAAAGFVVQHCFARCFNLQRIAVFYPPTLKAGEVWRLWTHAALHSDMGHLFVNLLHVMNTLDLEAVPRGSGYPSTYALGSEHVAGAAALATAYAALVGSVTCFGAMFEGCSALCFGLDGALLGACSLLVGAGADPALESFLMIRGCYAVIHMGLDILRGCSSPGGTTGNVAHFAGFVGGFAYIVVVRPPLGGKPLPTVRCSWGQGLEDCYAFFLPEYVAPVREVYKWAAGALVAGASAALANAFLWHRRVHASADGYSLFVKPLGNER